MTRKPYFPLHNLSVAALTLLSVIMAAQTTVQTKPDAPPPPATSSPQQSASAHALLASAIRLNSLTSATAQPWHMKATYELIQKDKPADSGTLEVWWAGPNQWRRTYTSKTYTATEWSVKRVERFQTSEAFPHFLLELRVARPLIDPLYQAVHFKPNIAMDIKPLDATPPLSCLRAVDHPPSPKNQDDYLYPNYCVDKQALLRMVATSDTIVAFSGIKAFNNRAVATQVDVRVNGLPVSTMHITLLEPLAPADVALITPDKTAIPQPWTIPYGEPPLVATHSEDPAFVGTPKALLRGVVRTSVVVKKDGTVQVVGRPIGMLSQTDGHRASFNNVFDGVASAAAAARFEPYVVDGETVEVSTTLLFSFDGKPFTGFVDSSAPPKDGATAAATK